jgi:type I protein arginine methyltransferase
MYSIHAFGNMIADEKRTDAYVMALQRAVTPNTSVLDIGTGTGIFAILACRFGARHVYAVEPSDAIHIARKIACENGYADRITFIQDLSTHVTLPERVNVVISDLHGVLPYYQAHIPSIMDARQRLLDPGGILIPQQDTVWAAIVMAPEQYEETTKPWVGNKYNLNMQAAHHIVTNLWSRGNVKAEQLLVEPQSWAMLDYMTIASPDVRAMLSWTTEQAGLAHGLSVWFDTKVAERICISNAPGMPELVYGNAFFPWTKPVMLSSGDEVRVLMQATLLGDDYIWRWDTRILSQDGTGPVKANFKQSTFHSSLLSPAQLAKKAADYVAILSEDGEIDRFILDRMDGNQPLGEIATALTESFPHHFTGRNDALGRVGQLSEKYSR